MFLLIEFNCAPFTGVCIFIKNCQICRINILGQPFNILRQTIGYFVCDFYEIYKILFQSSNVQIFKEKHLIVQKKQTDFYVFFLFRINI